MSVLSISADLSPTEVTWEIQNGQEVASFDSRIEISVCVCTYMRPDQLTKLLDSLSSQRFAKSFEVIVVDNDPAGSGNDAVNAAKMDHPNLNIRYQVESEKGISFARNTAVALAIGDFVAWVDDDEMVIAEWLNFLSMAQKRNNADGVFGPVLPVFPEESPTWSKRSGIFDRPRHRTGVAIDAREARTGNALVKASWLRAENPPFDIKLANTGGEDFDFFARIESQGARFEWCDEAEVFETVPLERQRLDWILERRLRASTNFWRAQSNSLYLRAGQAIAGSVVFLALSVAGVIAAPFGFHKSVKLWCLAMGSLGRTFAFVGFKWKGY